MPGRREQIRVIARVRPFTVSERNCGEWEALTVTGTSVQVGSDDMQPMSARGTPVKNANSVRQFDFDASFGAKAQTRDLYESALRDIVLSAMKGFNATIFLYGQTGSGKTHTLTGSTTNSIRPGDRSPVRRGDRSPLRGADRPPLSRTPSRLSLRGGEATGGMLHMAVEDIFREVERLAGRSQQLFISLSCVEVYNEAIYDLLREDRSVDEPLAVVEDSERGEFLVKGCRQDVVTSLAEANELLRRGETNRRFAETAFNRHSSRGHTMFRLFFESIDEFGRVSNSVCNFVDLAGSERLGRLDQDESSRQRATEGKHINKSLFFLTQIIHFLSASRTPAHVPYRNSVLTKLLKNSIGGNAKTAVILCLHPGLSCLDQSLGTLRFGALAGKVENVVEKNVSGTQSEASIARLIADFERKIAAMEGRLEQANNKEQFLAQINELEAQRRFLAAQYERLLCFNNGSSAEPVAEPRKTLHLRSCGALDSCAPVAQVVAPEKPFLVEQLKDELVSALKQRVKIVEEENARLSRELKHKINIFEEENDRLCRELQSRIQIMEQENDRTNRECNKKTQIVEEENIRLKSELQTCFEQSVALQREHQLSNRLIRLLLNDNETDQLKLGAVQQSTLIENALQLIENCKTVQIALALPSGVASPLAYRRATPPIEKLIEMLADDKERNITPNEMPNDANRRPQRATVPKTTENSHLPSSVPFKADYTH